MDKATRTRRTALLVLPYLAVTAVFVTLYVRWWDRLPEEMAVHFGGGMEADGFGSRAGFFWTAFAVLAGMGVMFGAMQYFGRMPREARRMLYPLSFACAALLGYLFIGTFLLQVDLESGSGVSLSGKHVVAALVVTAVAGFIGFRLAGVGPEDPAPEQDTRTGFAPRMPLRTGQRASWTRSVGTTGLGLVCAGAVVVSGVLAAALGAWPAAVPTLLIGLLPLVFLSIRVTVDRRGVRIGSGLASRLGKTIPLERISGARSQEISPLRDFHGWGYRVLPDRSGVVTRSGEALTVELASGREFVVTVDDSETAAALLNTLVDQK